MKAKRVAPKKVAPVSCNGITYLAPHFIPGEKQNGGFIEARDSNNELIYRLRVYYTNYKSELEKDVQDVYIKELSINEGVLIVRDEKSRTFHVNFTTREIKEIQK